MPPSTPPAPLPCSLGGAGSGPPGSAPRPSQLAGNYAGRTASQPQGHHQAAAGHCRHAAPQFQSHKALRWAGGRSHGGGVPQHVGCAGGSTWQGAFREGLCWPEAGAGGCGVPVCEWHHGRQGDGAGGWDKSWEGGGSRWWRQVKKWRGRCPWQAAQGGKQVRCSGGSWDGTGSCGQPGEAGGARPSCHCCWAGWCTCQTCRCRPSCWARSRAGAVG
jgi:hypothetical protein